MKKMIIHNETNKTYGDALEYVQMVLDVLSIKPDDRYFEFKDNVRVQYCPKKTCKTFYIY